MPEGLRLAEPQQCRADTAGTQADQPHAPWCLFEDDLAPAVLQNLKVELTLTNTGGTAWVSGRQIMA